jgi:thioredoxin-like negative regulator of GroEL
MPYNDQIITDIPDRATFMNLLNMNPGLILIKFGAEWCKPCQKINADVEKFFNSSPQNVLCAMLDVDESFDLYSYFKYNKITNGIPVIMRFDKGNLTGRPNDTITGTDSNELRQFYIRCGDRSRELM